MHHLESVGLRGGHWVLSSRSCRHSQETNNMALSVVVVIQHWCKSTDHMQSSKEKSCEKGVEDLILLLQGVIHAAPSFMET